MSEELEARVRDLELEIAARRKYEKVVTVLGYAVVAAAAIVGWIGYESFSDIESDVRQEVQGSIRNMDVDAVTSLDRFEEYARRMMKLLEELEQAEGIWRESIRPALSELEGDEVQDLMGRFLAMKEEGESDDVNEPVWRKRATAVVLKIVQHLEDAQDEGTVSQFSPGEVFNVAQITRRISRYDLEGRLVQAAAEAQPRSAAARALSLQSEARKGQNSGEVAFESLMDMVSGLTMDNPHIVLAEAWNAAEDLRRYGPLISAIDELIARQVDEPGAFLPSYAHALKGEVHLRRALSGDVAIGTASLVLAVNALKGEGMYSQWAMSTVGEVLKMRAVLAAGGAETDELDAAIKSSGIGMLQSMRSELGGGPGGAIGGNAIAEMFKLLREVDEEMEREDVGSGSSEP